MNMEKEKAKVWISHQEMLKLRDQERLKLRDYQVPEKKPRLNDYQEKRDPWGKHWLEDKSHEERISILKRFPIELKHLIKKKHDILVPSENSWSAANTNASISKDGLRVINLLETTQIVFAEKGFPILTTEPSRIDIFSRKFNTFCDVPYGYEKAREYRRKLLDGKITEGNAHKEYPGTIIYYYEVMRTSDMIYIGLSNGKNPEYESRFAYDDHNYFGLWEEDEHCTLAGEVHQFRDLNHGQKTKYKWHGYGDIIGCGVLMMVNNKLHIFFTLNGILISQIQIAPPSSDHLFPTVRVCPSSSLTANFGNGLKKPFKYDITKCPGLVFDEL